MYIEFDLLPGRNPAAESAVAALLIIQSEMHSWGNRHGILYRGKTIKFTHRVTFDQDQTYSFWAMTWNPEQHKILAQCRIVSDLNNKI